MPDKPLIVFDGACGFCSYGVSRLAQRWHLPARRLAWQSADLDALGLTEEQVCARMWYLAPGTVPLGGAAAIAAWLAEGDRSAQRIAAVLRFPGMRAVAEAVYRLVARNRHRIPGPWDRTCAT